MKFVLVAQENEFEGKEFGIQMEFNAELISDVLDNVSAFLKAAGYQVSGNLDFVEDTELNNTNSLSFS